MAHRSPNVRRINGTTLHVEEQGSGMPLLFVHGTGGGAFLFERVIAELPQYRCIAYDRRGNGQSAADGSETRGIEGDADDLKALVESLGIAPCVLVGLSWGSAVVVEVLRRYPEVCRAAVLGEPTIFALDAQGAQGIAETLQPRIGAAMNAGPPAAVEAFYSAMCGAFWQTLSVDEREPYLSNGLGMLRDLQAPPYAIGTEDLRAITTPCMLLVGEHAAPFHRNVAAAMREALPNAEYVEIANSAHVIFGEQPKACADAISSFLGYGPIANC